MLTTRTHESGLVLAEQALDEVALARALKRINDRLVLQKHYREGVEGGWVWKVLYVWSDSHPATIVLTWMDAHGRPLPLSSGLLEMVERHMVGARNKGLSADEHNRRLVERTKRDAEERTATLVEEHRPYVERGRRGVSMATARKRRYWQRAGKRPKSGGG